MKNTIISGVCATVPLTAQKMTLAAPSLSSACAGMGLALKP